MKDYLKLGGAVVVAVILSAIFIKPVQNVTQQLGATPGTDYYSLLQLWGGTVKGNYVATSTTDTATTMILNDFKDRDTISITPNVNTLTLTFPASSTLRSWLPKAGMTQETCWINATSTAAKNLVFAAGTGIDLQSATSTGNSSAFDLTISPLGTGCFTFIRMQNTDIQGNLVEYENAD